MRKFVLIFTKLFRTNATRLQLTLAIFMGLVMGLSPKFMTLQSVAVILGIIFFKVPLRILAITAAVSWLLGAILLDPLLHMIGTSLLEAGFLAPLWRLLSQMPIIPYSYFTNSVVMGSLLVSVILAPLVYLAALTWYNPRRTSF